MRLALRLLWQDWRSGELTMLVQALVIAVATVTSISLFTDRLQRALWNQSASFLAADRILEGSRPIPEDWWTQAHNIGVERSRMVQFLSMVFSKERAQFSSVKAIDDMYPLRGKIKISSKAFVADKLLTHGPSPGEVWLESRLIPALDTAIGKTLEIGVATFHIKHAIIREPDRGSGFENVGPRTMMHIDDLPKTNVIQPGSRITYRYLFAGDDTRLAQLDTFMRTHIKDTGFRYFSARNGLRNISDALRRAERFLLLGGLLAVLLAGVAIALTTRRYTTHHLDHVAIMKSFGASPNRISSLFSTMLILLLIFSTTAGLILGGGIQALIVLLLDAWIPVELPRPSLRPFLIGSLTGGLCLFSFAIPPILRLRNISPMRIIRRDMDNTKFSTTLQYGFGIAGFITLLLWYSHNLLLTTIILAGIGASLLLFGSLAILLLRCGQSLGMHAGNIWRLALSSIQRYRQENVLQVLAFGLVIMVLFVLVLLRTSLITEWKTKLPENAPNHFVINVAPDEKNDIQTMFDDHAVAIQPFYPVIRGRIVSINDVAPHAHIRTEGDHTQRAPNANSERNLTWSTAVPNGNIITKGSWWPKNYAGEPLISIEKDWANRNGIDIGDHIRFLIQGQEISARVTSIRALDWDTMQPNFYIIFSPQALKSFSSTYMTSFFLPSTQKLFLNDFLRTWPTVTVIEVDAILEQIQIIINQGTIAIELVFGLVLIAGDTGATRWYSSKYG